ncbi:hypothetical protein ILUMI_01200 [Ignelater luminosus]|uniref:Uncharacterized protein n=1 Tax=Ignelater luminosus TaxID=2038154 RepID=A0A8K0GPG3_IGNLU|nr:hypothetical protein ILUMI_01200 [Ignelater luminosus]
MTISTYFYFICFSLPYVVNTMYFYYFNKINVGNALKIVEYLKKSLRRVILDLDWMDSNTKAIALKKLNKMQIAIEDYGKAKIENYYKNLKINPGMYFRNVLQIYKKTRNKYYRRLLNKKDWMEDITKSASYLHTENRIFVPVTIPQWPFFKSSSPMYHNFGSLGWIVGSEIINGFDTTGRNFDDDGNVSLWWSEDTENLFNAHKQCIINQYRNQSKHLDKNVSDALTTETHIKYSLGIKLAYSAYYNWLKTHEVKPLINSRYSPRQQFWISAATIFCPATQSFKYLGTDSYHFNKYTRVIGPFRDLEEFSAAFNCPKGSKMNPVKKCQ